MVLHRKSIGTQTPRLNGSPKIHKGGIPLRPILCMRNYACHKLTSWIVHILNPVRKDSFQLSNAQDQPATRIQKRFYVGVDSLSTNVPSDETVGDLFDNFYTYLTLPIPVPYVMELLSGTENVRLEFEG